MTLAIGLAFAILILALIVFTLDIFPIDFVAFAILALILGLGPVLGLTPEEAISGFSNPATITVMAMFILSGAIERTGIVNLLAQRVVPFGGKGELRQLLIVLLLVGPVSAFLNNTAVVAILMPMVITLAREHQRAPSSLLIPLSFFSQLAGVVTLIGTSTNILASSLAASEGYGPFGMFEFTQIGLLIFAVGALYMLTIGRMLLPHRPVEPRPSTRFGVKEYLSEVVVSSSSPLVGKSVVESRLREQFDIHILEILRNEQKLAHPLAKKKLQAGDILFVKGDTNQLLKLTTAKAIEIETEPHLDDHRLRGENRSVLEVVIGPNADLIGGSLEATHFRQHYNCTVIAIRKHGEVIRDRLNRERLEFGDTLLLRGSASALEQIKREPGFIVTESIQLEEFRTDKAPLTLAIVTGVVLVAALGQPILVTAIIGCALLVLTGCLKVNELHQSIHLDVIFLLAGMIPVGLALESTGAAQLLADLTAQSAVYLPPIVVLGIFYVVSMLLTGVISNNAAVVVMVPVGMATAETLGLDARAFILAIMFAASTSFYTPVGYQTNTMVYGPGGYKFLDFTRVGLPLNILLTIVTPIAIYYLWGL
jgi:di/tricarboxylate transporter